MREKLFDINVGPDGSFDARENQGEKIAKQKSYEELIAQNRIEENKTVADNALLDKLATETPAGETSSEDEAFQNDVKDLKTETEITIDEHKAMNERLGKGTMYILNDLRSSNPLPGAARQQTTSERLRQDELIGKTAAAFWAANKNKPEYQIGA